MRYLMLSLLLTLAGVNASAQVLGRLPGTAYPSDAGPRSAQTVIDIAASRGASPLTWVFDGSWQIGTNIAFQSNDVVKLLPGASWALSTGATSVFNGAWFDAPGARVFYGSGTTDGTATYPYRRLEWAPAGGYQLGAGYLEVLPISITNVLWAGPTTVIATGRLDSVLQSIDTDLVSGFGHYQAYTNYVAGMISNLVATNDWMYRQYTGTVTSAIAPISSSTNSTSVGTVMEFAGPSAPIGWLSCDGTVVPTSTYTRLHAAIGTTYGTAQSGYFRLPDMQGRVPIGRSTNTAGGYITLGAAGGSATEVLTVSTMAAHTHNYTLTGGNADSSYGASYVESGGAGPVLQTPDNYPDHNTRATGSGTPHNNLAPYIVLRYIIKY